MQHGTITTLSGVSKYHPFRVREVLKGQQGTCLVDSGATHNFINVRLVVKRGVQVEGFSGFSVMVVDGFKMTYTKVSQLSLQLGDYIVIDDFYVVEIGDTNVLVV